MQSFVLKMCEFCEINYHKNTIVYSGNKYSLHFFQFFFFFFFYDMASQWI